MQLAIIVQITVYIYLYYMLTMCVHTCKFAQNNLVLDRFETLNWCENGVQDLLCDSNYTEVDRQMQTEIKDLNIIQLNIRGINLKVTELKYLIDHSLHGSPPDIIALCETWLTKNSPIPKILGYKLVQKCREDKRGGGVALLISNRIQFKVLNDITYEDPDVESCFVEIKLHTRQIIIGSCYRPPNTDSGRFIKSHKALLQTLFNRNRSVIIGMDHNLDLLKSGHHSKTQEFLETNLNANIYPTIIRPTRISKTTATLIDNIFVSLDMYSFCKSWILIDSTSDHLPCLLMINGIKHKLKDPIKIQSRDLKYINRLKHALSMTNWEYLYTGNNIEENCTKFATDLSNMVELFIPIKSKTIPYGKLRKEAWITPGILKSIRKEKQLYREMIGKPRLPVET